ncbi:ATP-binding cassette domain-containing protein [Paenibacillus sp. SC116]|uniref:ABC transporter ATP-binding protein n=1 Tax=Paenibacillus sp. SC116 TaxID=2968986 RepID=UPI00215B4506|nr:ATP-binding cassette domain-containing protein [Paenibacillus sp. SC116]MCR8845934.1 ATP-binding cassette domain-containing protein [Paenibacillus sp. SC116]
MLHIEQVCKVFNPGSPDEKLALSHINLQLRAGEFVTIIGSNGAGKSTLMNLISGVLLPDIGSISIGNQSVTSMPEHARSRFIGRVFQDPMAGTAPSMTIEENLAIAKRRGRRRGLGIGVKRTDRKWFKEQLATLGIGLEDRLYAKAGLLSGGERQALSLLMATFMKPELLLLDEHTAALDPARAELITTLTEKIVHEHQLTTLMVTHNMEQAIRLGNRLIMMDKGRIILDIGAEQKRKLTVDKLLYEFERVRGVKLADDRVVLGG